MVDAKQGAALRRYDVDWLRIIALMLLILYHAAAVFQPWGHKLAFVQNKTPIEGLWVVMMFFNIWRIPILFVIAGMGCYFAFRHHGVRSLLKTRFIRIMIPYFFGFLCLGPLVFVLFMYHQHALAEYVYFPASFHLWFLWNIYVYVLLLIGLFALLKAHRQARWVRILTGLYANPYTLWVIFAGSMLVEAVWMNPLDFVLYYEGWHGFVLGLLCFYTGFMFAFAEARFWVSVRQLRYLTLCLAVGLLCTRYYFLFGWQNPPWRLYNALVAVESASWMLALIGFATVALNKASPVLSYLSKGVFPIYIIHLPLQQCFALLVVAWILPPSIKYVILVGLIMGASLLFYEGVRRIPYKWLRVIFGVA